MSSNSTKSGLENNTSENWLEIVREHVNSLRFGVVEIVVHESRVVQIEKTERVRLDKKENEARPGKSG
jgi:hypothetical protein